MFIKPFSFFEKITVHSVLTAVFCFLQNTSYTQPAVKDTAFTANGNPMIRHLFTADPGAMV